MREFGVNFAMAWLGAGAIATSAWAAAPLPGGLLHPKLNPGYHHPDFLGFHAGATHDALVRAQQAGTLETLMPGVSTADSPAAVTVEQIAEASPAVLAEGSTAGPSAELLAAAAEAPQA